MSHFITVVLVPSDTENHEEAVSKLLAPYDENMEVDPYEIVCYCITSQKKRWVDNAIKEHFGFTFGELRKEFEVGQEAGKFPRHGEYDKELGEFKNHDVVQSAWKAHIDPWLKKEKEFEATAEKMGWRGDPDCEECGGTGQHSTTYNPNSKWDWWVIGGRWNGFFLSGYDPKNNPDNWERCYLCNGTGKRPDMPDQDKCNGCNGEGQRLKWHDWIDEGGNNLPVKAVLDIMANDKENQYTPFAIVTPDGEWHERGEMGWWAIVNNEKDRDEWKKICEDLYEKYKDHIAIVCDLHI